MQRWRILGTVVGVVFVALLVAVAVKRARAQDFSDVAKSYLEAKGWDVKQLEFSGFTATESPFTSDSATVTYTVRDANPPKKLLVHLKRLPLVSRWEVVNHEEQ